MNAKQCDRCGKCYTSEEEVNSFSLTDERWRYNLTYDAHPYGTFVKDLCPDCLKSLYSWFKMENNNG